MGHFEKYKQYLILIEAVSSPSAEVVAASKALLFHVSAGLSHFYNYNSFVYKDLKFELYFSLLCKGFGMLKSMAECLWSNW